MFKQLTLLDKYQIIDFFYQIIYTMIILKRNLQDLFLFIQVILLIPAKNISLKIAQSHMSAFRQKFLYSRDRKIVARCIEKRVHLALIPQLGTKLNSAFRKGVHLYGVHLQRVDCIGPVFGLSISFIYTSILKFG